MFMYLRLDTDENGKVHATVLNQGSLPFSSLGGPNSQRSDGPFSVMKIHSFLGLENIDENDLLQEVFRRYTTKELIDHLIPRFTKDELLGMIRDRMK